MVRALLSSVAMLAVALVLVGCSNSTTSRNDMPIKAVQGVDKKGNATKSMDLSGEDPNYKGKKK